MHFRVLIQVFGHILNGSSCSFSGNHRVFTNLPYILLLYLIAHSCQSSGFRSCKKYPRWMCKVATWSSNKLAQDWIRKFASRFAWIWRFARARTLMTFVLQTHRWILLKIVKSDIWLNSSSRSWSDAWELKCSIKQHKHFRRLDLNVIPRGTSLWSAT